MTPACHREYITLCFHDSRYASKNTQSFLLALMLMLFSSADTFPVLPTFYVGRFSIDRGNTMCYWCNFQGTNPSGVTCGERVVLCVVSCKVFFALFSVLLI